MLNSTRDLLQRVRRISSNRTEEYLAGFLLSIPVIDRIPPNVFIMSCSMGGIPRPWDSARDMQIKEAIRQLVEDARYLGIKTDAFDIRASLRLWRKILSEVCTQYDEAFAVILGDLEKRALQLEELERELKKQEEEKLARLLQDNPEGRMAEC